MIKYLIPFFLTYLLWHNSAAQNPKIDSLKIALDTPPVPDTSMMKILNALGWEFTVIGEYETGIKYSNQSLNIANTAVETPVILREKAGACVNMGVINYYQGEYNKALEFYLRALTIYEELRDLKRLGSVYNNIGMVYDDKGEYTKALEFLLKALKIREELGDKQAIAASLGNIGGIHYSKNDYDKALDFHLRAVKIREETGNKKGLASSLNNIGIIYDDKGDYAKALEYQQRSIALKEEIGDVKGLALSLGNIGNTYKHMGDFSKAIDFLTRSLKMKEDLGDKKGMASSYNNIGLLHLEMKNFSKAKEFQEKNLRISNAIASRHDLVKAYEGLSRVDSALGNFKEAYHHHHKYTLLKDSLFNEEASKKVIQSEMNFEFEKKEQAAKHEQDKKDALAKEEIEKQKMQRNGFVGAFILMLTLAGVTYRSYRNKKRSHRIIEQQKKIVEERNRDISDSINYAKRLQEAILPSARTVSAVIEDSFILYKPKDIVAGDFYWIEKKDDLVFIAAADCTGHGVPGAMISVVCSNALNRTVKEFGLTDPGKILDKVRELVIETFEKSESEVKDGMDISLCVIDIKNNGLAWAGANNPLWYLAGNEIIEIKADKQPIGKNDHPKPFTSHHLKPGKGNIVYLFTDGYADQFGGEDLPGGKPGGKKFKYSKLKELLLDINLKPMLQQKAILDETFQNWKGNLDQVDDVCVIGVRI
ncbi:MAG TPA: tetratricopeptide repeat protein [Bacteroidia bacterium]|jgi:tetratricopeptide (TPR) repeat protein